MFQVDFTYAEALRYFQQAIAIKDNVAATFLNMGNVYTKIGM